MLVRVGSSTASSDIQLSGCCIPSIVRVLYGNGSAQFANLAGEHASQLASGAVETSTALSTLTGVPLLRVRRIL